jgi:hypothetical protein
MPSALICLWKLENKSVREVITGIGAVVISATMFWIFGFVGQKLYNGTNSKSYSIWGQSAWTCFFGVKPRRQRVYLRFAYLQIAAFVYAVVGLLVLWFFGRSALKYAQIGWVLIVMVGALVLFLLEHKQVSRH